MKDANGNMSMMSIVEVVHSRDGRSRPFYMVSSMHFSNALTNTDANISDPSDLEGSIWQGTPESPGFLATVCYVLNHRSMKR